MALVWHRLENYLVLWILYKGTRMTRRKTKPEDQLDYDVWLSTRPEHDRDAFFLRRLHEGNQSLVRHVWAQAIRAATEYHNENSKESK